jgi:hypothetical protein
MAPKKIATQLSRYVSIQEKVKLRKGTTDMKAEKVLYMKRNFCAYNCDHEMGTQVMNSDIYQSMKRSQFAAHLMEPFSDEAIAAEGARLGEESGAVG